MHSITVSLLCGCAFMLGAVLMLGVCLLIVKAKNKGITPALKEHWDKSLDLQAKQLAQSTRIASAIEGYMLMEKERRSNEDRDEKDPSDFD